MKTLLTIIVIVLVVDFLGFLAWALSGQYPPEDAYVGALSTNVLQWLIYPNN